MGLEIQNYIPDTHIAWVEWDDEASFQLQYVGADEVEAVLMERAQRASVRTQNATSKDRSKLMIDYLVDGILLGWKGLTDNGKPYPYTKENARTVLTKSKELRDFIHAEASKITNFKEYDDLKNSKSGENKN